MKSIELELQEVLKELKDLKQISLEEASNSTSDWEQGYGCGAEAAYDDAIERCTRLMEVTAGLYPES